MRRLSLKLAVCVELLEGSCRLHLSLPQRLTPSTCNDTTWFCVNTYDRHSGIRFDQYYNDRNTLGPDIDKSSHVLYSVHVPCESRKSHGRSADVILALQTLDLMHTRITLMHTCSGTSMSQQGRDLPESVYTLQVRSRELVNVTIPRSLPETWIKDPTASGGELHVKARQLTRALTPTTQSSRQLDSTTVDHDSTR